MQANGTANWDERGALQISFVVVPAAPPDHERMKPLASHGAWARPGDHGGPIERVDLREALVVDLALRELQPIREEQARLDMVVERAAKAGYLVSLEISSEGMRWSLWSKLGRAASHGHAPDSRGAADAISAELDKLKAPAIAEAHPEPGETTGTLVAAPTPSTAVPDLANVAPDPGAPKTLLPSVGGAPDPTAEAPAPNVAAAEGSTADAQPASDAPSTANPQAPKVS